MKKQKNIEDENGAVTKNSWLKLRMRDAIFVVGILIAGGFTTATYLNDKDVRAEALVNRIEDVADEVKDNEKAVEKNLEEVKKTNDGQDKEIKGIREGIGFIKGQLSTLIGQLDDLKRQNENISKAVRRRREP